MKPESKKGVIKILGVVSLVGLSVLVALQFLYLMATGLKAYAIPDDAEFSISEVMVDGSNWLVISCYGGLSDKIPFSSYAYTINDGVLTVFGLQALRLAGKHEFHYARAMNPVMIPFSRLEGIHGIDLWTASGMERIIEVKRSPSGGVELVYNRELNKGIFP